jgi:hypothetical protein
LSTTLESDYLGYLSKLVGPQGFNPRTSHSRLLRQLHTTEFVFIIPNDDNRVLDGLELRAEFLHRGRMKHVDREWETLGCSCLEMMIGLSRRLSFEAEGEPREWFWIMIDNLGLTRFDDDLYDEEAVEEILTIFVYRQYLPDGQGGLFPLQVPHQDQREVDLWYQMNAYLLELD